MELGPERIWVRMERGALPWAAAPETWVVLSLPGGAEAGGALRGGAGIPPGPRVLWVVGGGSGESPLPSSEAAWRGVSLSQG